MLFIQSILCFKLTQADLSGNPVDVWRVYDVFKLKNMSITE